MPEYAGAVLDAARPAPPSGEQPERPQDGRIEQPLVSQIGPADWAAWDHFVDGRPEAGCYHLRAWKSVAEHAYGLPAPFLAARRRAGGPLVGVLPLFVAGPPWSRFAVTGMFGAYGNVLADRPSVACALLDHAARIAEQAGARNLVIKAIGPLPDGLSARRVSRCDASVFATLSLPGDPDQLWRRFRDKTRNCIRKAQRSGLELRVGVEHLAAFYDVLADNMHRKGMPIYGLPFVRELVAALGGRATLYTLWKDGIAVSGALSIHYHGVTSVPFASSRRAYFKYDPNNLIYWEMMREACLRGDRLFDFGRSPKGSSTLAFKLGWGAEAWPQPIHVWNFRGRAPTLTATPFVEKMARIWTRLPRRWADAAGPAICARFLV